MKCQTIIVLTLTVSVFAQQPGKKTSVPAQSSSTALKLSPAEVKQRMLKLVAGHQPATIAVPIALTRAKLKHSQIIAELVKQKSTVEAQRMTILASAHSAPQAAAQTPAGKNGTAVSQAAKASQSTGSQSRATPMGHAGVWPSEPSHVSPVINPNISAAVCHGPTIDAVNGRSKGAWFTPDPQYNHYTIQGCGFGNQQGSAHLYGPFAAPNVGLTIEFWSDTSIIAVMDATISGEPDHIGNVALVVAPANGPQVQATGLNFYAVRQEVQLGAIPRSQVGLQPITDAKGAAVPANLLLPGSSNSNGGLAGVMSSLMTSAPSGTIGKVIRSEWGRFGSAQDSFNFGQLAPGFYPDKAEFWHSDITNADCSAFGWQTELYVDGNWNVTWDDSANALRVTTQEQHCHQEMIGGFGTNDFSLSDYWLAVWVVGPRGVNPWPGNLQ